VETLVTAVEGVSKPRFRFLDTKVSKGASSISKALPEAADERDESSSLESSRFVLFSLLAPSLYVKFCNDAANALVWRRGTKSECEIEVEALTMSRAILEVFIPVQKPMRFQG